jgi:hypothetical protein
MIGQQVPDSIFLIVDVVHVGTRFFQQILHRRVATQESSQEQGGVTIIVHCSNPRAGLDQAWHPI